ncbi:flagellar assembly protein FliH [Pseudomonas sp. SWI44]|nr:flagellar assembly protein FliH [Pseudomonas sp. SWI44]
MDPLGTQEPICADPDTAHREQQRKHALAQRLALQRLRDQAQSEAERLGHAQGKQLGYAQGLAEGREAAAEELRQQVSQTLEPLRALCLSFDEALREVDSLVARQVGQVALELASRLAGMALAIQPEQVEQLARRMLACEPALTGRPSLNLNPDDLPWVQGSLGDELAAAGWTLHADPSVAPGGCRALSATAELDATRLTRQTLFERNGQWLLDEMVPSQ